MRLSRLHALVPLLLVLSCGRPPQEHTAAIAGSFDSDGTRINYTLQGSGEPVILIHGFALDSDWNWRAPGIIDSLVTEFRVIAMDVRGHGKSATPHGREAYGRNVLLDIGHLMDHLKIERAHLVGYSMGGEIALAYLLSFPERVSKAVVGGAGWVAAGDSKHELWRTHAALLEAIPPGVSVSDHLFPGAAFDQALKQTIDAHDPAALSAAAYGMLTLAVDERALRNNTVPTMLIIGENDQFKPGADKARAAGSRIEMTVLAGQDHLSAIRDPVFVRTIRTFLRSSR